MKLGIVTNYNRNTVNFGNILQTYALNYYLRSQYPNDDIETVNLHDDFNIGKKKTSYFVALIRKVAGCFQKREEVLARQPSKGRVNRFRLFADKHIILSEEIFTVEELNEKRYDVLVVGSDVVWSQIRNNYNTVKFLCFKGSEKAVKFSYAASFGNNDIPFENRRRIKAALVRFKGISVRERSSIDLLGSIGINDAVHVCDPTLLLDRIQWSKVSTRPRIGAEKYILCFLLNPQKWQLDLLIHLKLQTGCSCIYVTNGYGGSQIEGLRTEKENDMVLDEVAPDEWLWLIENAALVVTDSFHCMIFSNIFRRKYLVLKRDYNVDINNRMIDFLVNTGNGDKFVHAEDSEEIRLEKFLWDYTSIEQKTGVLIEQSKDFIDKMMRN